MIEPIIDSDFMENSHGFRPGKSTHSALEQCVKYYEEGYRVAVDCDLKSIVNQEKSKVEVTEPFKVLELSDVPSEWNLSF